MKLLPSAMAIGHSHQISSLAADMTLKHSPSFSNPFQSYNFLQGCDLLRAWDLFLNLRQKILCVGDVEIVKAIP